ncbi:hypothetical protein GGR56DRAFT_326396 [Xylariaceae sp. FL0804]|nr:hypothetical protein GGR56DRAFT_326396 [Xylariaceae sp. FL0804]
MVGRVGELFGCGRVAREIRGPRQFPHLYFLPQLPASGPSTSHVHHPGCGRVAREIRGPPTSTPFFPSPASRVWFLHTFLSFPSFQSLVPPPHTFTVSSRDLVSTIVLGELFGCGRVARGTRGPPTSTPFFPSPSSRVWFLHLAPSPSHLATLRLQSSKAPPEPTYSNPATMVRRSMESRIAAKKRGPPEGKIGLKRTLINLLPKTGMRYPYKYSLCRSKRRDQHILNAMRKTDMPINNVSVRATLMVMFRHAEQQFKANGNRWATRADFDAEMAQLQATMGANHYDNWPQYVAPMIFQELFSTLILARVEWKKKPAWPFEYKLNHEMVQALIDFRWIAKDSRNRWDEVEENEPLFSKITALTEFDRWVGYGTRTRTRQML